VIGLHDVAKFMDHDVIDAVPPRRDKGIVKKHTTRTGVAAPPFLHWADAKTRHFDPQRGCQWSSYRLVMVLQHPMCPLAHPAPDECPGPSGVLGKARRHHQPARAKHHAVRISMFDLEPILPP
jgi:hypothetical protein